jgi:quinol monooxygenase YgiN
MSQAVTVIAQFEIKASFQDFVKSQALKLISATQKEPGCLLYTLHQSQQNTLRFVFTELWASEQALLEHNETEHLKRFIKAIEPALLNLNVEKLTPIASPKNLTIPQGEHPCL